MIKLLQAILTTTINLVESLVTLVLWIPSSLEFLSVSSNFMPYLLTPIAFISIVIILLKVLLGADTK